MRPHMNWTWPLAIAIAAIGVSAPTGRAQETADGKMKVSWDAVYMSGTKIGTIQTTVERLKDPTKDRDLFRVNVTMDLTFKRKNDRVRQQVRYGTLETVDGSVLRLDVRILAGENEVRSFGDVIENKLTLNLDGGGQRQQNVLDWGPEVRGPHAPEQSLARAPLKVGETREEKMFIPSLNRIGTVKLIGEKMETIELGGRVKRELLKVQAPVFAPDGKVYAGYWEFPGGKVEPGETVEQALARELHEELGITIGAAERWKVEVFDYPHALVRLHFCKVFDWRGEFVMREGQQMAWQTLPVQVAPVLPGTVPVLRWFAVESGHCGPTHAQRPVAGAGPARLG